MASNSDLIVVVVEPFVYAAFCALLYNVDTKDFVVANVVAEPPLPFVPKDVWLAPVSIRFTELPLSVKLPLLPTVKPPLNVLSLLYVLAPLIV